MNETLELPKTIDEAIKLLKEAGVHMDGKGRDAVTSQTSQTVDNVISLVDSFVNYTIDFMKEVRVSLTRFNCCLDGSFLGLCQFFANYVAHQAYIKSARPRQSA